MRQFIRVMNHFRQDEDLPLQGRRRREERIVLMPLLQKAFRLHILVPVIALIAIFVAPTTTFAHAASGGPSKLLRTASVTSFCPDCERQNPWHYLHHGDLCASNARVVATADIQGGIVELFYS